jgi:hypothetical protein
MPRRSTAALSTVPVAELPRPAPPKHLPAPEAKIWRRIVEDLPPRWLPAGSLPLLEVYVTTVVSMHRLRAIMAGAPEGSARYTTAAKLLRSESEMVVKVGKLLRLGPRFERTALRTVGPTVKPWHLGGGDRAPVNDGRTFAERQEAEEARKGDDGKAAETSRFSDGDEPPPGAA